MAQLQAVKGTRDIFPDEIARWHHVEGVVHSVASLYGFSEIRTPVFEYTELFQRGIGATTDIVGKEMFTFLPDPNGRSLIGWCKNWQVTTVTKQPSAQIACIGERRRK